MLEKALKTTGALSNVEVIGSMQIQPNRKMKYNNKKLKKKRILLGTILMFFVFCAVAAGAAWWKLEDTLKKVASDTELNLTQNEEPVAYNKEPISLVIIGTDERADLGMANTDVIIVAALNPQTKHVTMMPIPRDTGVKIPGYNGYHKINSVYARGEIARRAAERNKKPVTETGTTLLKKTIEEALGIPINYYVMTDFEGFEKVVDELGGVEIEVDKSMKYDDPTDGTHINLQAGLQRLDGDQALGFVRHRKDNRGPKYYSTDFDRGVRQQTVIKSLVDKMKSFTGIASFFNVLDVAGDHIRTDLSKEQIKGLIMDFKSIGSDNIAGLETGGYWDVASSHTIIPKENLEQIQLAFQEEMGIERKTFRSTIRVEAPGSQRQANVTPKSNTTQKAAEAAPKQQASEVKKQTTEKPKSSENEVDKKNSSSSGKKPSDSVDFEADDAAAKPSKTPPRSDSESPRTPAPTPNEDPAGMLQPPVNSAPVGSETSPALD
ncbi:hypothetical protein BEP19_13740 [Ammoniphilus oxalaticus]|uniref:Cell envelope-related transcriptional attenuator domain-containing protein n=1 Tax=Ammoniphilus oxalaticus TaxID=66863 RepID=A0A419SEF7_9BACL|nr:LCP family protein [Ammoniphilus oxalaticus]RKD21693.1 hypothetical protein BEP19_13740 [Ammoniphilus oxalaticus]